MNLLAKGNECTGDLSAVATMMTITKVEGNWVTGFVDLSDGTRARVSMKAFAEPHRLRSHQQTVGLRDRSVVQL